MYKKHLLLRDSIHLSKVGFNNLLTTLALSGQYQCKERLNVTFATPVVPLTNRLSSMSNNTSQKVSHNVSNSIEGGAILEDDYEDDSSGSYSSSRNQPSSVNRSLS